MDKNATQLEELFANRKADGNMGTRALGTAPAPATLIANLYRIYSTVRLKIIGNEIIKTVGRSESCMVSKLPIIWKRTRIHGPLCAPLRYNTSRLDLCISLTGPRFPEKSS